MPNLLYNIIKYIKESTSNQLTIEKIVKASVNNHFQHFDKKTIIPLSSEFSLSDTNTVVSSSDYNKFYTISPSKVACSCQDWIEKRSHQPRSSYTRVCKHLASFYSEHENLIPEDLKVFSENFKQGRTLPYDLRKSFVGYVEDTPIIIREINDRGWINIYEGTEGYYGFNLSEVRFSYNIAPRNMEFIVDQICHIYDIKTDREILFKQIGIQRRCDLAPEWTEELQNQWVELCGEKCSSWLQPYPTSWNYFSGSSPFPVFCRIYFEWGKVKEITLSGKTITPISGLQFSEEDTATFRHRYKLYLSRVMPHRLNLKFCKTQNKENFIITEDENEAFFLVQKIIFPLAPSTLVSLNKHKYYCDIIFNNEKSKPICRFKFNKTQIIFSLYDNCKNAQKLIIEEIEDIKNYAKQLHEIINYYLSSYKRST